MEKNISDDFVFVDMNWVPYKVEQQYYGPPLSYASDKLEQAIIDTHNLFHQIGAGFNGPNPLETIQLNENLKLQLREIFYNSLKSFLAINNNLEVANGKNWDGQILNFSQDDLTQWISDVWRNGPTNHNRK